MFVDRLEHVRTMFDVKKINIALTIEQRSDEYLEAELNKEVSFIRFSTIITQRDTIETRIIQSSLVRTVFAR
jgi:uncharacterized Fe-S cluster-containing MiaB family protein